MSDQFFAPGTVVQLRSGGPLLTVSNTSATVTDVIYFNNVTGMFETFETNSACLREANQPPQVPTDARILRNTPIAKSTL